MNARSWTRRRIRPAWRFLKYRVLHVDDSPHRIALGAAIGVFIAFLPPLGYQMIIAALLCLLLRGNAFIGAAAVWISNPLTFVPIYYPSYLLGRAIVARLAPTEVDPPEVAGNLRHFFSRDFDLWRLLDIDFWHRVWQVFLKVGLEMLTGGVILGALFALVTYAVLLRLVRWYRHKHPQRHLKHLLHLERARRRRS